MTQAEAHTLIAYITQNMLPGSVQARLHKRNSAHSVIVILLQEKLEMHVYSLQGWQGVKAAWSLYIAVPCDWCRAVIPAEEGQYVAIHDVRKHLIPGNETVCRACVRAYRDAYYRELEAASA